MRYLRKNTAVRITVGPFFDKTDGITPEVALTATNEHLTLTVDDDDNTAVNLIIDANATASGGDNDMVHVTNDDAGFYDLELTAAQTNYVGRAMLAITYATDHCPVFHEFTILPANVYDAMVGTDYLFVDALEISSDETAANNAESFFDGTGYAGTNNTIPTVTAAGLSAAAVDAIWDEPVSGHATAASFGKYLDSDISANTDHITADYGATEKAAIDLLDDGAAGTLHAAVADAVWDEPKSGHTTATNFGDLAVDIDKFVFTVANKVDANVYTWNGTAVHTPGTAGVPIVEIHDPSGVTIGTVTNLTNAATNGDLTATMKSSVTTAASSSTPALSAAGVDAIWDEVASGHVTAGSFGKYLDSDVSANTDHITADYGATEKAAIDLLDDASGGLADIHSDVGTVAGYLDTEVAAILADTNELQTDLVNGGRLDLLIDAIKAKTDSLTFTVAGKVDSNVYTWNGTSVTTPAVAGQPVVTLGDAQTAYAAAKAGDSMSLTAAAIDLIWDEPVSGHATAASFGKYLDSDISANTDHITADYGATEKAAIDLLDDASGGLADIHTDIGTVAGYIDTEVASILAAVDTEVAAILADTNELQVDWVNGGRLDLLIDAIKAKTDSLTFTVSGKIDSNVYTWNGTSVTTPAIAGSPVVTLNATQAAYAPAKAGDAMTLSSGAITAAVIATGAVDADALATDAVSEIADGVWDEATSGHVTSGTFGQAYQPIRAATAQTGAAGSITLDASANANDDWYNHNMIIITGGTGAGQTRWITDYTGSSKVATIAPSWVTNPSSDSVFVIMPEIDVAGLVWDELATAHNTAGTYGKYLGSIKAKTDSLTFTVAGKVDSNVYTWNGTSVTTPAIAGSPVVTLNATQAAYAPAKAGDAMTLTTAGYTASADALLNRDMSAVSDTTARSPLNAFRFLRNKWVLTDGTLSVKKEDDSTEAWGATVSGTTGADPVTGVDPS